MSLEAKGTVLPWSDGEGGPTLPDGIHLGITGVAPGPGLLVPRWPQLSGWALVLADGGSASLRKDSGAVEGRPGSVLR